MQVTWGVYWVLAHVFALQYLNVSSWSASIQTNQTFGHLLKQAVIETHLQPAALR